MFILIIHCGKQKRVSVPQAEYATKAEASTGCVHPAEIVLHGGTE